MATIGILLAGTAILLLGNGLFSTLLGVRASLEEFDLSTTGLIMSSYFLGYIGGSFLCVHAVLRVGHIRTFAALSALLAAIAVTHAIFVDPLVWGILRLAAGFCIVGLYLVIESWLNARSPAALRGRVFSVYMTVNLLAVAVGQFLLVLYDPREFQLFGLVTILFALSLVPIVLARVEAPAPQEPTGLTLGRLYRASPVGVVGCLASGFIAGSFWGMGPVFAKNVGLSQSGIAAFMSVTILGGMLAQWPVGLLSDRRDRRKIITAAAAAAMVAAVAVFAVAGRWMAPLIALSALFGAAMFPLYSLAVARTHDMLDPEEILEATRGLVLVFGVGAVLGPLAAGFVMDALSPAAMFAMFALTYALLVGFCLYRMPRRDPVPVEAQTAFVPLLRTSQQAAEMAEAPNLAPDAKA